MKILIVGSGGREHALAWRVAQSRRAEIVFVAPGNSGTALGSKIKNVDTNSKDIRQLIEFVEKERIGLTIIGPEEPMVTGIVDESQKRSLRIFGPTKDAAQLESSKIFAKAFMVRHDITIIEYGIFSDIDDAHQYIDQKGVPIVIKADDLASGKGVVVAVTLEEAHGAAEKMLSRISSWNSRIVIEEFLEGEEASFIAVADGRYVLPLTTSQDHKRLKDGDIGPNTGGMGAYSPAYVVSPVVHHRVMNEIIIPTLKGMEAEGMPFSGFLIDSAGNPKNLEFNCRMGDPEAQVIMPRLKSDFLEVMEHAADCSLGDLRLDWDEGVALGIVMVADYYPSSSQRGDKVCHIPGETADGVVFHAGVSLEECAVRLGRNIHSAKKRAYGIADKVIFRGAQFRRDIGWRVLRE